MHVLYEYFCYFINTTVNNYGSRNSSVDSSVVGTDESTELRSRVRILSTPNVILYLTLCWEKDK